jgi:NAD(P)-dependent dehydrogenase (short-subunit alcohol dehydrogenase family)
MNRFNEKVVVITGATKGLGRALALSFAREGAKLAVCARNQNGLDALERELKQLGAEFLVVRADAAIPKDIERFVSLTEEQFGKIDVLINNASMLGPSPIPYLLDYPAEDFCEVLRVNTLGPYLMTRRVLPGMLQRNDGVILNVTSEAGRTGFAGWGAYGVSKFALEGLTQTWASEIEETKVRMNSIDPGEMNTEMHELAVPNCDYELAEPAEVVDVFLYLASDEAAKVNNQRFEAQGFKREE